MVVQAAALEEVTELLATVVSQNLSFPFLAKLQQLKAMLAVLMAVPVETHILRVAAAALEA
jgi:hypothetical protein